MMEDKKKAAPLERGAENHRGTKSVCIIRVIEVQTVIGKGTERDPKRIITEYWSPQGELLAVRDPEVKPYEHQLSHH